ncbi:MAG: putative NADPH-dependent oxidoreductase [Nitrospira sp.]|jgi:aryl-alcohol dehydrogenase-like predicted oxidoreductase|nr:putative NADPH-dependent oxidoreductase [Nitrospira sp.]
MKDKRKAGDFWSCRLDRRQLLKTLGIAGSLLALNGPQGIAHALADRQARRIAAEPGSGPADGMVPRRMLGKTGVEVSALCFGGSHLGRIDGEAEAIRVLHEAIDAGITFMDNAWEYNHGVSEERMGKALQGRRQQVFLMTKVCSHGRDKKIAMQQLEESLRRLRTDYIDLWQIHEVIYVNDPDRHFAPGGATEALMEAKRQGKVRFLGFTGHKDPDIHLKMLQHDFPFDTCQLPLNVFDGTHRSFEREVLPVLNRRGIAPLAMKSLSGTGDAVKQGLVTVEEALRYVLSLPVATVVSGIDSRDVLRQNLSIARTFTPMTVAEMDGLRTRMAPYAKEGKYELFKSTNRYDGRIGREQQGLS